MSRRRGLGNNSLPNYSPTTFMIPYAGCPVLWKSTLQSCVVLSTTEAEYFALSSILCEIIALKNLLNELESNVFKIHKLTPKVFCRTYEDNKSCIEIVSNHKIRPRTKHLSVLTLAIRQLPLNTYV